MYSVHFYTFTVVPHNYIYEHAEMTAVVAEKDAVIEELRAQLAKRDASAVATSKLLILVRTLYMIMTQCLPIILSYIQYTILAAMQTSHLLSEV